MLYPEFDELVSYKNLKLDIAQASSRPSRSLTLGGQHSPFRGQGLEFDSVRKYVPGDDIRNIDWRVTARTGSPHLKIFHEERQRDVVLCIDMNAGMRFGTRHTFKSVQSARIAALLGWQGMARQDRISACLFGDVTGGVEFFTTKNSKISFSQLLKTLSVASPESHSVSIVEAFRRLSHGARTGSLIYVISDFLDMKESDEFEVLLSRLNQRCDVVFISVNDAADKALLPVGELGVLAKGLDRLIVNTDSVAGRKAYAQQWEENRQDLYQRAARFGIPLIELTTESNIKKDLWLALKTLSNRRRR